MLQSKTPIGSISVGLFWSRRKKVVHPIERNTPFLVELTCPTREIHPSPRTRVVEESHLDFRLDMVESAAEKDWVWLGLG